MALCLSAWRDSNLARHVQAVSPHLRYEVKRRLALSDRKLVRLEVGVAQVRYPQVAHGFRSAIQGHSWRSATGRTNQALGRPRRTNLHGLPIELLQVTQEQEEVHLH